MMKLLNIFLLIFIGLRYLEAGVQFRHFPITNGRSESHGTSKFETRIPAKPTGRPSRPSDLNPLNLINEDNMFPKEKPQRSGSLADEIRKQLSAHLKSSSVQKPLEKKKSDNVIKDVPVKSFRQPAKSNTISTRQRFNIAAQQITTQVPTVSPFKAKSTTISARQRFNIIKQQLTTQVPNVIPFKAREEPFVEKKLPDLNTKPTARVKIPVKKKRLVFRGRGRKIESRENVIKRVPVDISSLDKQNVLKAISKVAPVVNLHRRKETDTFSRKIPLSPIKIKPPTVRQPAFITPKVKSIPPAIPLSPARQPTLGRQSAVAAEKKQQENIIKPEIKSEIAAISLSPIRRKPTLGRQSSFSNDKRRQENINTSKVKSIPLSIPLLPVRKPNQGRQSVLLSEKKKQENIRNQEIRNEIANIHLPQTRRKPSLGRQSTTTVISKPKIKIEPPTITSPKNRRLPQLSKISAKFAEKRQKERKNNFTIKPRRRDELKKNKAVLNTNGAENRSGLTAIEIIPQQKSSSQDKTRKEFFEERRQTDKRIHIPHREQSVSRQNNFLPRFFEQPKKSINNIQHQQDKAAQFEQVTRSNFEKVKHVISETEATVTTPKNVDVQHVEEASFQSIHPFNVKINLRNHKQRQEIIQNVEENQQPQLSNPLNLNHLNSRVLPVIPLNSNVRITPKGIDIKTQLKQINEQRQIPTTQPSLVQAEVRKPITIPSHSAVSTKRIKNVTTAPRRSSTPTVTVPIETTTIPNSVTWVPTTRQEFEQETTINEIEYTTQIPKRNLQFEEISRRQHPDNIKLNTDKILKITEEEELSNEILVYPTYELAMEHAIATWEQDPYRKTSKDVGRPMFDIDYSLDPENNEAPYVDFDPAFTRTTPITTQRPVNTTPRIIRESFTLKRSRNQSIKPEQNTLQSLPSERSQQIIELQFRRQQELQRRRDELLFQNQDDQFTRQLPQQERKQILQEKDEAQFLHQQLNRARQESPQPSIQQDFPLNTEEIPQPQIKLIRQPERQISQKSRQQITLRGRQQIIPQANQQQLQVKLPPKEVRQQFFQHSSQQSEEVQHLATVKQEQPSFQESGENELVNNSNSGNIRFRNKARGPKSERRLQNIPVFDQFDYVEEDRGVRSEKELDALRRALTFTIDWGR